MANPELSPPLSLARPTGVAVTAGPEIAKGTQSESAGKLNKVGQSLKDVTPEQIMDKIKKKAATMKEKTW